MSKLSFSGLRARPPWIGLAGAVWLLTAIPHAALAQNYPTAAAASALGFSLLTALILRALYVRFLAKRGRAGRRVVSPWLFLIATLVSLVFLAQTVGQNASGNGDRKAVEYGIAPAGHITPADRCAGLMIDKLHSQYPNQRDLVDTFARQFCHDSFKQGLVARSGLVENTSAEQVLFCSDWEVEVNRERALAGQPAIADDKKAVKAARVLCTLTVEGKLDPKTPQGQAERLRILKQIIGTQTTPTAAGTTTTTPSK